ncbi:hypothetical protein ACHQM5_002364 [Ranunculus cassubicifolius]
MSTMVENVDLNDPLQNENPYFLNITLESGSGNQELHGINGTNESALHVLSKTEKGSRNYLEDNWKTILKNNRDFGNSEFPHDRDVPPRVNNRPQERRPGLAPRKRARFSIMETTSQSDVVGGTSLDIEKLGDPEEFFSAVDNQQRAEKELQRQRGEVSISSIQHSVTKVVRKSRTGLLGHDRKRSVHQDRFASEIADADKKLFLQKSISKVENLSQPISTSIIASTDENNVSQEKKLNGERRMSVAHDSAAEGKNKVANLLDDLLSQDSVILDGEIFKKIGLPPINVEKLCMDNVDSVRKSDDKILLEVLPGPIKALSDIQNVKERVSGKGSSRAQKLTVTSTYSPGSPTPPRYPFPSVPMLFRDDPDSDRSGNPVALPGIDSPLPIRDSIHVDSTDREGSLFISTGKPADDNGNRPSLSDMPTSIAKEKNHADSISLDNLVSGITSNVFGSLEDSRTKVSDHLDLSSNEHYMAVEEKAEEMQQPEVGKENTRQESNMDPDKLATDSAHSNDLVDENSTKSSNQMDQCVNGSHEGLSNELEKTHQPETMVHDLHGNENHVDCSLNGFDIDMDDKVEDVVEPSCERFTEENASQFEKLCPPPIDKDLPSAGPSENEVRLPEDNNEVIRVASRESLTVEKSSSQVGGRKQVSKRKSLAVGEEESLNVGSPSLPQNLVRENPPQKKAAHNPVRKTRQVSRRKSLIGAGTEWKAGVRRSTRMRMKPLEYWKGERLIYGRVHESLVTVIGCEKCGSPCGNNGGPKLKVFNYKDLQSMAKV